MLDDIASIGSNVENVPKLRIDSVEFRVLAVSHSLAKVPVTVLWIEQELPVVPPISSDDLSSFLLCDCLLLCNRLPVIANQEVRLSHDPVVFVVHLTLSIVFEKVEPIPGSRVVSWVNFVRLESPVEDEHVLPVVLDMLGVHAVLHFVDGTVGIWIGVWVRNWLGHALDLVCDSLVAAIFRIEDCVCHDLFSKVFDWLWIGPVFSASMLLDGFSVESTTGVVPSWTAAWPVKTQLKSGHLSS